MAGTAAAAAADAVRRESIGRLGLPFSAGRPRLRYWPGADVTPAQVADEVNAMADAGFGGFEIGDVRNSEHVAMPAARYGWGSPAWKDGVAAALRTQPPAAWRPTPTSVRTGPQWPPEFTRTMTRQ
jgi:hypothetical protein